MITWERGAGFTLACGTGATACVSAGFKLGKLDEEVEVPSSRRRTSYNCF